MGGGSPAGSDWTDREIDLIVADYFDMLRQEIAAQRYVKARRNAELQRLTGRSRGSIEFKHENISAVLAKLGLPWISGYKPMPNFQRALIDGIERYLSVNRDPIALVEATSNGVADTGTLFVGPPPTLRRSSESEPPILQRLVRKFDPAARDERNRTLGKRGEERVVASEISRLRSAGRDDLAGKVRWISQEDGDGAGFDVLSFTDKGDERLLEVKTTTGYAETPFYLSANERALAIERPVEFRIFRVYDFVREPKAFEIAPPLESALILEPANYRASFC